jgi:hypothetical protein
MIIGFIKVDGGAVVTHRDTYDLESITVASVRRPHLASALLIGGGLAGFALMFADLLYASEMAFLAGTGIAAMAAGFWLGQLKLLSRDLRGSELVDAIWGSYSELNHIRRDLASHLNSAKRQVQS